MLSLRYFIRLLNAFLARFKAVLLIGIFLGALLFLVLRFIGPHLWGTSTEKMGLTGRYHTDNLPNFILESVGDGLTRVNEAGIVEPNLAKSWETPDKGKTWVFHLKDNIFWQDGKEVTSETINYQFSDVTIERPDSKTIIFKLQDPFSPFPVVVSKPVFKKGLLGTGEWKVTKATIAGGFVQKLVLVNEEKDKKIYKFYPTEERTKTAYKLGKVNTLVNIFNPTPFDTWKTAEIIPEVNRGNVVAIFFNTQDAFLSEKSLRQALVYAIKKDFEGKRALSPISPDSWAYNPQVKSYSYDIDRVEELLEDFPEEVRESLNIKLVTTPTLLPIAEKITQDWQKAGIKTTAQVYSGIPTDYQAFLAVFNYPIDPDQYSIWHSTQESTNISHYQNPRIDKLLEDGRVELNLEERKKIYLDFQRFLVEDSPAAFLYHPISYKITRR
jgi:peptide/nickel transport system substrate-binding protein